MLLLRRGRTGDLGRASWGVPDWPTSVDVDLLVTVTVTSWELTLPSWARRGTAGGGMGSIGGLGFGLGIILGIALMMGFAIGMIGPGGASRSSAWAAWTW